MTNDWLNSSYIFVDRRLAEARVKWLNSSYIFVDRRLAEARVKLSSQT